MWSTNVCLAQELRVNIEIESRGIMAYYRVGMRFKLSRAAARAMARSGNKQSNTMTIERMIENAKHRFGGAVSKRDEWWHHVCPEI